LPIRTAYRINVFDISGSKVKTLKGIASGTSEQVQWNFRDEQNNKLNSGIYLYRFESSITNTFGKLIIK
jgi:flagellar hook assembly protein FlgD